MTSRDLENAWDKVYERIEELHDKSEKWDSFEASREEYENKLREAGRIVGIKQLLNALRNEFVDRNSLSYMDIFRIAEELENGMQ